MTDFIDELLGPAPEDWEPVPNKLMFYGGDWPSNFCVHERFEIPLPLSLNPTAELASANAFAHDLWLEVDNGEVAFHLGKLGGGRTREEDFVNLMRIWGTSSPLQAKRAAGVRSGVRLPAGWNSRGRIEWMLEVQRRKYTIPRLRRLLLNTGDQVLCENSVDRNGNGRDDEWGCRTKGSTGWTGANYLGRVLMKVRFELQQQRRIAVAADERFADVRPLRQALAGLPPGAAVICGEGTPIGRAARDHARRHRLEVTIVDSAAALLDAQPDCLRLFASGRVSEQEPLRSLAAAATEMGADVQITQAGAAPAAV